MKKILQMREACEHGRPNSSKRKLGGLAVYTWGERGKKSSNARLRSRAHATRFYKIEVTPGSPLNLEPYFGTGAIRLCQRICRKIVPSFSWRDDWWWLALWKSNGCKQISYLFTKDRKTGVGTNTYLREGGYFESLRRLKCQRKVSFSARGEI